MNGQPVGLLLFRLAGRRTAIDLGIVAEVSELPPSWPIPLAPSCFAGAINFHGALVPILDMSQYLKTGQGSPQGKLLVLDRQFCDLALWVDGVERITGEFAVVVGRSSEEPFMKELLTLHDGEVPLLDVAGLLDTLEDDMTGVNRATHTAGPV